MCAHNILQLPLKRPKMASPYSILPVAPSDLPTIAEFLYSSKLKLTINRLLFKDWPNEAAQRRQYTGAVEGALADPNTESLKAVDAASGEIVGYLAVTRKSATGPAAEDEKSVPEAFNPEVYQAVIRAAGELSKEMEGVDHLSDLSHPNETGRTFLIDWQR
ncbi:hypothetical protein SLS57_004088 [Botryosphaeria dothidea]